MTSTKCGLVPNQVYLKRGERKQLIFWTDQNYNATTENPEASNQGEKVDLLLQLVNGAMPKPEQIFNVQEEESYPQFQGVPSTTTTTTTTSSTTSITTTTTTKATPIETPTTIDTVEVDTEISNDISTTYSSITIPDELADEVTGELLSVGDEIVETTLKSFTNDLEATDINSDNASPATTNMSNDSESTLPASTTFSTLLDEIESVTNTPLTISENEEEIVEIVEAVPSQLMEGPTPSIIMAEIVTPEVIPELEIEEETDAGIVTPEDMELQTHNETDISVDIQHESMVDDMSQTVGLLSDIDPITILETTTNEMEAVSADSTTVTINPLLAETTKQEETNTDVDDIAGSEFTRTTRTTISNIDGFHITVSQPIIHESKTEPPIDVLENENIDKSEVHIDTIEGSGIKPMDEEKEDSKDVVHSTTESIMDVTFTSLSPVSDVKTTTENIEISYTDTTTTTEKVTTTGISNENIEILSSTQITLTEGDNIPKVNVSYNEGQDNNHVISNDIDTINVEEEILDDDDYSNGNVIFDDISDTNGIETTSANDVKNEEYNITTTTMINAMVDTTEINSSDTETTVSSMDIGVLSTEAATTVDYVEKDITNEQNNVENNEEVDTSPTTVKEVSFSMVILPYCLKNHSV